MDDQKIIYSLTSVNFEEYGYYEGYLLTLGGKRKLNNLIPLFIDGLGDMGDLINEESMNALVRIGTADISKMIGERYHDENDDFKIYAAGVLEGIKLPEGEQVTLKLLKNERHTTNKTLLAGALCRLFTCYL